MNEMGNIAFMYVMVIIEMILSVDGYPPNKTSGGKYMKERSETNLPPQCVLLQGVNDEETVWKRLEFIHTLSRRCN